MRAMTNLLRLFCGRIECVKRHHSVGLVGKEAASIVHIDDCGAREDAFSFRPGINGDWLVLPMVEISGCSMTPMLIPSNNVRWII